MTNKYQWYGKYSNKVLAYIKALELVVGNKHSEDKFCLNDDFYGFHGDWEDFDDSEHGIYSGHELYDTYLWEEDYVIVYPIISSDNNESHKMYQVIDVEYKDDIEYANETGANIVPEENWSE